MRDDVPALLPLVCPRCRTRTERGREMHTLSVEERYKTGASAVIEGVLACDNPDCGRRYPIVDGVPLVVPGPAAYLRSEMASVVEADLAPETEALLAEPGPDDAPFSRMLEHLSIFLDAHWGDRTEPPPDGPVEAIGRFGLRALSDKLATRAAEAPVDMAAELGCSVGRGLAELARGARLVVGVDLHFGAVRRARRLLAGAPLPYARRVIGRHYRRALARAGDRACDNAVLLCADALDPPLVPGAFQRVAALNVLDSLPDPARLLSVADGLLGPGGELILASPYTFQTGIVDEDARFGGADPAGWLRGRLVAGTGLEAAYTVEEEADLPWSLRRDARSAQSYAAHYLRARKRLV